MLRAARASIPLTVLSDSECALGVVLRRQRRLASGGSWFPSGQRHSFPPHRRFFRSQSNVPSRSPMGSFGKRSASAETVELTSGSAGVRTLLPAQRNAASRSGPPVMSGLCVGFADQFQQAGSSIAGSQETRCREQETGSCRRFGVFAAAAHKAGQGGIELWTRQDVLGDHRSFHVLVVEPGLLLVKGHTAGVIQFCVCHKPDSLWRSSGAHVTPLCR